MKYLIKKINIGITACFAVLCFNSFAQAPNWQWANNAGGPNSDVAISVASDATGNLYATGWFYSPTIVFGSTTLTNADNSGSTADIFIVKYDVNGAVIWAVRAGGTGSDFGSSITIDALGNMYLSGYYFSSTISFGSTTFNNIGVQDMFVAKYDSSGGVIWAQSSGSVNQDNSSCVKIDAIGNVYVIGRFVGPSINFGTTTLTCVGGSDFYIVKYDASGAVLWAIGVGGSQTDVCKSIAIDPSGNILITGSFFSPSITFGSITLTNSDNTGSTQDIFIAKYDSTGQPIWATNGVGSLNDEASSVTTTTSNEIYVTGYFYSSTIVFGTTNLINADNTGTTGDIFLLKYDSTGTLIWAKRAGGNSWDVGNQVITDDFGGVFIAGALCSTLAFGTSTLTNTDTTGATGDICVLKYDSWGNEVWGKTGGGYYNEAAYGVTADAVGNIIIAGGFTSSSLALGSITLPNANSVGGASYDMFVAKLATSVGVDEENMNSTFSISPNPTRDKLSVIWSQLNIETLILFDATGRTVRTYNVSGTQAQLSLEGLARGVYYLRDEDGYGIAEKVVVER
jgi:hypothetical protein